eukprot:CAMPEP_0172801794 /NCGR_PEP_ID=MMETSP1075-20121228/3445_1 /TAXON_ID=2916 /ORGANISM="Ceratium fusus, Strain PA161109" /LENGTH=133 /DNA_ID=CAMNT_0013639933 /DNA_START=360 /DNA_END=762 /DNA_ORIENTATION=+
MSITSSCRRPHGNGVSRKLLSSAAKNLYGSSKKSDEGRIQSSNGPRPVLRRSFGRFVPKLTLEALSPLEDVTGCVSVSQPPVPMPALKLAVTQQASTAGAAAWQARDAGASETCGKRAAPWRGGPHAKAHPVC